MPGAISWDASPVPVISYDEDGDSHLVGSARNVERDENGVISAEIDIEEGWPSAYVDAAEFITDEGDVSLSLTKGRLRGVTILREPGWPWPDRPQRGTVD